MILRLRIVACFSPSSCWKLLSLLLCLVGFFSRPLHAQKAVAATGGSQHASTHTTLHVGSTKQLFLDNKVIDRMENVKRALHRPIRYSGNPIIEADKPWETSPGGGFAADLGGGTVLFDEEEHIFKMWYRTD